MLSPASLARGTCLVASLLVVAPFARASYPGRPGSPPSAAPPAKLARPPSLLDILPRLPAAPREGSGFHAARSKDLHAAYTGAWESTLARMQGAWFGEPRPADPEPPRGPGPASSHAAGGALPPDIQNLAVAPEPYSGGIWDIVKDQCPPRAFRGPRDRPTSVHQVRISDIKFLLAIGDSVMTGFGTRVHKASQLWKTSPLLEYRGTSFAMGNDPDVTTLYNIFNLFSSGEEPIKGSSGGHHHWQVCWGPFCRGKYVASIDGLNAAQSGAMSMNLMSQAEYLIDQLTNNPAYAVATPEGLQISKDYKLLTFWAGANDLCLACWDLITESWFTPAKWEARLRKVFERLRKAIPNVIVNVIATGDVSQLYEIAKKTKGCFVPRNLIMPLACPCVFAPGLDPKARRERVARMSRRYSEVLEKIVKEYQAADFEGFTLVFDPGMGGVDFAATPKPGKYVGVIDCFHPSLLAHEMVAIASWNNLFKHAGHKNTGYNVAAIEKLFCPDHDAFIATEPPPAQCPA